MSLLRVAHRHFRHYTLHPYANYFSTQECIDIISFYYEHLVFDDDITASIRMELEISEQPLIGMVEQATSLANKINERARVLLKDLLSKDLNVKVSNFEKNAAKHIAGLWDFLEDVTCDDKNLKVVIKARFEFERYSDNKKNHNGIRAHADRFSRAITDFNTDLRKTTALKGFVNMVSSIHAPETMPWYQETFITLCFPKNAYPFDYHKESFSLLCKHDKKISKSIRIFTNNPRSTKYSELAKRLNIDTQQGSNLVDFIKVLKSQNKDDKRHMTTVSIVDYLHQKMAMFDSIIFLNEAQARWHKCAKKYCSDDVSATQLGGYAMTLFSALLIENKTIIPLIAPPDILIKQSGSLNSIAHTDKKHLMMIKNTLQMLPLPKLETMPDGLQKEMAVGIPSNSHMLLDVIKSSMAKMFFMKLTLKGLNCKINEVRDTSSHSVNKNSRMPKRKSHSSSRTKLRKIIMRFSMWN